MQLGRASTYCIKQSLALQKPGLLAAFAMKVKNKTSPGRAQLKNHLQLTGKKWGSTAEREKHTPA